VAIWNRRLGSSQAESIALAGHDADLREVFGAYNPDDLEHYWRLGEDLGQVGVDWIRGGDPIDFEQAVGLDYTDVVDDAP
jgi:hypothetical protein